MSVMQETQKIAAVVLFKDLHSKKMDVYDVLAAFIGDIIVEKGLTKFSTVDMSGYLVDDFGFDSIPQNVIKNAIRRTKLTESRDGFFLVKRERITETNSSMESSLEEEIAKNEDIINGACTYIEGKRGKAACLSDARKGRRSPWTMISLQTSYMVEHSAADHKRLGFCLENIFP